jgi:hypothetical protein
MRWIVVVGLVLVGSGPAWALFDDNSTNQEQEQGQGQHQGQGQDQGQAQGNIGINGQGQTSVGSVSVDTDVPPEKTLAHGSMAPSVPQGNEGVGFQTPWGGPMITQGSQMAKYQALAALGETEQAVQWALVEASPKLLLGIPHTEKGCRNWLLGLLCF